MNVTREHDPLVWLATNEIQRATHAMRQTLKISNEEVGNLAGSLAFIQLLGEELPSVAVQKRFLNQPYASDAMLLMSTLEKCKLRSQQIHSVLIALSALSQTDFAPLPLITGDDLTRAGALPGPKFKQALDAAYDAQLEDRISTKEEAMQLAMGLLP